MSLDLVNKIRPLAGFTFAEKSILFQYAHASHRGEPVCLLMGTLATWAGCNERTARRIVKRLEVEKKVLVPIVTPPGRGHAKTYRIDLTAAAQPSSPVEAPTTAEPPPPAPNGHKPTEEERAMEQVKAWFPKATEQVARARERIAKKR